MERMDFFQSKFEDLEKKVKKRKKQKSEKKFNIPDIPLQKIFKFVDENDLGVPKVQIYFN